MRITKEEKQLLFDLNNDTKFRMDKEVYKGFSILSWAISCKNEKGEGFTRFCAIVDDGEPVMDLSERPKRVEVVRMCREYIDQY